MKFMQFFKILNINFEKISFITFSIIVFYKIFLKLKGIFDSLKIIYWNLLRHCPSIQIIYIPILNKYMTTIHLYHNLSCICYWLSHIYKQSDIFLLLYLFLRLITCSYQSKDLILLWSFLKLLAMLIQELKGILQDQVRIF